MDYQSVPILSGENFHEWRNKVKTKFIAYGPGVWKFACDGYSNDHSPFIQEQ